MKPKRQTVDTFFALLRAGLWEQGVRLQPFVPIDFDALYQLADEQSVVGLIAAGLEHVEDMKITKPQAVPFLKKVVGLEGKNGSMNEFVADLMVKMRNAGMHALLVKGQGIAQCYERPGWRSHGDVDLLVAPEEYERVKVYLTSMASHVDDEGVENKHQGMIIDPCVVELHGTLHGSISARVNEVIDEAQEDCLARGGIRVWRNGDTDIELPSPDNDIIFIFTHFLNHFFRGGVGLRQICDWCRLLWTYRDSINRTLLEQRVREMRLLSEWKAFAAYAVDYLGMPATAMPLYEESLSGCRWSRKSRRINSFILSVGNFGHNRDNTIYERYPYLVFKAISLGRHIGDFFRHLMIFPLDSLRVFFRTLSIGVRMISKGK